MFSHQVEIYNTFGQFYINTYFNWWDFLSQSIHDAMRTIFMTTILMRNESNTIVLEQLPTVGYPGKFKWRALYC